MVVQTLSSLPLDRQIGADGATWLDRELVSENPEPLRESGFGKDVRDALARRRQWLIAEGLAHEEQSRIVYRANMLDTLRPARTDLALPASFPVSWGWAMSRPGRAIRWKASIAGTLIWPAAGLPSSRKAGNSPWCRGGRCWRVIWTSRCPALRAVMAFPGPSGGNGTGRRCLKLRLVGELVNCARHSAQSSRSRIFLKIELPC